MNNPHPPTNRAKRPVEPSFKAFLGLVFLVPSIPFAVWAYWCFNGTAYYSDAERGNLEGAVCSIVSLLFFANAIRLFIAAFKARRQKPQYEVLDWQQISIPQNPIEVKYKKLHNFLFAFLVVFFGGMAILIAMQTLGSSYESATGKIYKGILFPGILLLIIFAVGFLQIRAKRQAVKLFDSSGITRGDGRRFAWREFRGTVKQITFNQRTQRRFVWRIEMIFDNGETAWIIPNRVKNYEEVFSYTDNLPSAIVKN